MILDFEQETIENFKTFVGKPQIFHFTGDRPGLRFIRGRNLDEPDLGSNGSGKSSLWDALTWCLYGRTVDGLRTPDIVPWSGKGNPTVNVQIYTDKTRQIVTRSANPNKLLIEGKEADQDAVDQLLGLSFDVFKHTILLGQGQPLFFDLAPKEKMEVFAEALNLSRWDDRATMASEATKGYEAELVTMRADFDTQAAVQANAKTTLKQIQQNAAEWDATRKERKAELGKLLDELKPQLTKLQKKHAEADLTRDSAGTELKALERNIAKLIEERVDKQNEYNKADLLVKGLKDVINGLQKELTGLTGKGDTCPTCGQPLRGTALAHHKTTLTERIQGLQVTVKAGVPKKVALALETAVSKLAEANSHAKQFREKADAAQTTLNIVVPEMTKVSTTIRDLQARQKEHDNEANPHREQIQSLRKKISSIDTKLDVLDEAITTTERIMERTRYWVKGFKDLRLYLLEELLQELELATNALLPESGLHSWSISYSVEKETKKGTIQQGLNLTVLSPHNKKPVRWECWSGGESHRLRVVGSLALAEVLLSHAGVQTNLQALDEPTRDLSVEGVQDLCEFLAARAKQLDQDIFLTGHNVIESAHFIDTIEVVKKPGGISHIIDS